MNWHFFKTALFLLSPEQAHKLCFFFVKILLRLPLAKSFLPILFPKIALEEQNMGDLKLKNAIGVAAGLDKNAEFFPIFEFLGFAFVEVGSVTPKAQAGNPLPRLFRIPEKRALYNRMGFNNDGCEGMIANIKKFRNAAYGNENLKLGINIGKNKDTPQDMAIEDYLYCAKRMNEYADYFVINISSPNTQNLRDLQNEEFLQKLKHSFEQNIENTKPVWVKLSPDMQAADFIHLCQVIEKLKFSGLILNNTSNQFEDYQLKFGSGGLSGEPIRILSRQALLIARKACRLPIISVGGVMDAEEVIWRLQAGACAVQLYSALVYEGPFVIQRWQKSLQDYFKQKKTYHQASRF